MDSGAMEVVAPPSFAPDHRPRASTGSNKGVVYRAASGNMLANHGRQRVRIETEGSVP